MDDEKLFKFLDEEDKKNPKNVEKDIEIIKNIREKYNVESKALIELSFMLQMLGYGRNSYTANLLRAVADMIESPIETRETIEAKIEGKLQ